MTGGRILVTVVIQTNVAVTNAMVPVITAVLGRVATNICCVDGQAAQTIAVAITLATVAATLAVILVAMR